MVVAEVKIAPGYRVCTVCEKVKPEWREGTPQFAWGYKHGQRWMRNVCTVCDREAVRQRCRAWYQDADNRMAHVARRRRQLERKARLAVAPIPWVVVQPLLDWEIRRHGSLVVLLRAAGFEHPDSVRRALSSNRQGVLPNVPRETLERLSWVCDFTVAELQTRAEEWAQLVGSDWPMFEAVLKCPRYEVKGKCTQCGSLIRIPSYPHSTQLERWRAGNHVFCSISHASRYNCGSWWSVRKAAQAA